MVDKLKNELRIPIWAVTIIIGIMLSLITYTSVVSSTIKQTDINTDDINTIKIKLDNKLDKSDYKDDIDKLFIQLNRIESRIDNKMK